MGLGFPVNGRGGLSDWGAGMNTVPQLCVEADVVVVHGGGGPLDVGDGRAGWIVFLCVPFASPAGDVEGLVLVAIGEMEEPGRGCRGVCGGVEDSIPQFVRVGSFGYAIVAEEAGGSAMSDPGFAEVEAGCPRVGALVASPRFFGV